MSNVVTWSLTVSKEIDRTLRTYFKEQGISEDEFSRFVEDAVRWRVLDRTVEAVKKQNRYVRPEEIEQAIDEAVQDIRAGTLGNP